MSILKRWDEDYNNNNGIPWSEFVKTVDKSNYSPELFNDSGDNVYEYEDEDDDLYPEDDNLYSDEEIASWEKERAGNKKSSKEVEFITVHPNGGEGHVIAIDDEKKVVSPDAGEFKGTTLSSAKSVGLDELEKKSSEKSSKKSKSKSDDDDDEPAGVEKGTKEYYQAKVDKYEKRLKMYSMKMEELQKKIDSGDGSAADELEKYNTRQARVEKKLAGYKKNLEKFSDSKPSEDVKKEEAPSLSKSKSEPTSSTTDSVGKDSEKHVEQPVESSSNPSKSDTVNGVSNVQEKLESIDSAMSFSESDEEWDESASNNIKSVNSRITPWNLSNTPGSYQDAIKYYTKGDYRSFNWAVVGSRYTDITSEKNVKNAKILDKIFNDPSCKTTGDTVLFRSMNSRHLPKGFLDGEPYVDNQIVSTSASHKLTHEWIKANKCELAIYLPKGSTAANISQLGVKGEHETLLPPNTAYKFIGVVGYRESVNDNEPHPVYAVEAYTPTKTDISGTISKNKKLFEEIQNSGRLPDEFHKGIYNLSESLETDEISFKYLQKQFGPDVSEESVWEYYNKYKDMLTGGKSTPKGVHADILSQLKADEDSEEFESSISSSKSTKGSAKATPKKAEINPAKKAPSKAPANLSKKSSKDLSDMESNPSKYTLEDVKTAAQDIFGKESGFKWYEMYQKYFSHAVESDAVKYSASYLKYYADNPDHDPWKLKSGFSMPVDKKSPSIKKASSKKA